MELSFSTVWVWNNIQIGNEIQMKLNFSTLTGTLDHVPIPKYQGGIGCKLCFLFLGAKKCNLSLHRRDWKFFQMQMRIMKSIVWNVRVVMKRWNEIFEYMEHLLAKKCKNSSINSRSNYSKDEHCKMKCCMTKGHEWVSGRSRTIWCNAGLWRRERMMRNRKGFWSRSLSWKKKPLISNWKIAFYVFRAWGGISRRKERVPKDIYEKTRIIHMKPFNTLFQTAEL